MNLKNKFHLLVCCLSVASIVSISALQAQYPVIKQQRPRIVLDSERFSYLKQKIDSQGDCKNTYNEIMFAYNNWWINDPQLYLLGNDSTKWTWEWSSQWASDELILTVLLYKLNGDPTGLKRCRFIASEFIKKIQEVDFQHMSWYEKEDLLRQMSDAGGILLDWCYEDLPEELRRKLSVSMFEMNREFMNTYILSSAGNSYVSSHNTWNNIFCNQNVLVLYEAEGLDQMQKDTVISWYKTLYDKLITGFLPCWTYYRDDDGGWNWGAAYSMWSLVDQFQLFENMRIGTDKNFFHDLDWIKNSINQYLYFIQPDGRCIHLGDGETSISADRVIYLHARYFKDPRSLWLAQYYSQPSKLTWTIPKLNKLMYKDFDMPEVQHHNSEPDWYADKVGLSVSFSSWEKDAAMLTFFNSPSKRAAHEHRDNNSFTIFKNKPLLIDAGYYDTYGGDHYKNYYQRSIAHNTICVYDSTEKYSCFGLPASNDGGQIESTALQNYDDIFLPVNQRGNWIKYSKVDKFVYNISDAQLSYNPAKLDLFRRRVFYLKPDKVLVLDHVHLKNTGQSQRDIKWTGHMVNKPEINGNIINSQIPGHIDTYNANDYYVKNGNGNLSIRTLLPRSVETTLIGGKDHEYWVDGINYSPLTVPDTNSYTPGNWRIEVRPEILTDTVIYLHTISVGDNNKPSMFGGIVIKNDKSIAIDWDSTLFFFAAKGDTGIIHHHSENIAGDRKIDIIAADMQNGNYDIKVNNTVVAVQQTNPDGLLVYELYLKPGDNAIEIVRNLTMNSELAEPELLSIYPNPSDNYIHLGFNDLCNESETEIYNSAGEKILSGKNILKIDISQIKPGIYLVKSRCHEKLYNGRFTKL